MLKPRERWVYKYRFQPTVRTDRIKPPSALDLMRAVEAAFLTGQAFEDEPILDSELPRRTAIRAIEVDDTSKTATILLSHGDPQLSDTVFEHLKTGKQRPAGKRDGEGVSFACHLVMSLKEDQYGSYPMVLEDVPYLSKSRVVPFIKRMVKKSPHEFAEIDENGKSVQYTPSFDVAGDLSQRLEDELRNGVIRDIVLTRRTRIGQGLDEDGYFRETARQIKLKIDETGKKSPWVIIEKIRNLAKKQDMDTVKVHYVRDDDKNRTMEYRSDQAYDPRDALNVRCELLEFNYDLPVSRDTIDEQVQAKMKKLLSQK